MIERFSTKNGGGYDHSFLSNFYEGDLIGLPWIGKALTAEHAYQSMKAESSDDALSVLACSTPGQAKRLGRKIKMRNDWEARKIPAMRAVLRLKFDEDADLADQLCATGDEFLQEGNDWNDHFWGRCWQAEGPRGAGWYGQNWLGFLLMARRAELRAEK